MKILICDQQLMLAEALASALDARGYDVLAFTANVDDISNAFGDYVPDVCLLGLQANASGFKAKRLSVGSAPGCAV
jgi:DNA-binding response OmpR family regulator